MARREGVEGGWKTWRWRRESAIKASMSSVLERGEEEERRVRMIWCIISLRRKIENRPERSSRMAASPLPWRGILWMVGGRRAMEMM